MHLKKGDNVKMISGKDRGKTGKVLTVLRAENKIVVAGLNLIKRHQRARRQEQKGQVISKERAVPAASAQLVCPKCGRSTRVGHKIEDETKQRICRKCGGEI